MAAVVYTKYRRRGNLEKSAVRAGLPLLLVKFIRWRIALGTVAYQQKMPAFCSGGQVAPVSSERANVSFYRIHALKLRSHGEMVNALFSTSV